MLFGWWPVTHNQIAIDRNGGIAGRKPHENNNTSQRDLSMSQGSE